jgi:hypothetical protein
VSWIPTPALYGYSRTLIDVDLPTAAGVGRYVRFMNEAADLVDGGSLSGEHGDGQ